jgi:hypothetical protein
VGKNDYDEKDMGKRDQRDEKDVEKREEKSAEEKWQRDPLGALVWAFILIWAGVVLLASNLGAFDLITEFTERLPFDLANMPWEGGFFTVEAWTVFWLGASAILLIEVVIRVLLPQYRRSVTGTLILAIVFLGLAVGRWECTGPLILIAIGVGIVLRNVRRDNDKE